jgi:hypothetical protein
MRILKNATRLGALAFAGVTTAIPIAGYVFSFTLSSSLATSFVEIEPPIRLLIAFSPVVVTFKTLETRALVKREQL